MTCRRSPDQENVVATRRRILPRPVTRAVPRRGGVSRKRTRRKDSRRLQNDGFFDPAAGAPGNFGKGLDEQGVLT